MPGAALLSGQKPVNHGPVGRGQMTLLYLLNSQPVESCVFMRMWLWAMICQPTDEGMKHDVTPIIRPGNSRAFARDLHFAAEFFSQLTVQRLSG